MLGATESEAESRKIENRQQTGETHDGCPHSPSETAALRSEGPFRSTVPSDPLLAASRSGVIPPAWRTALHALAAVVQGLAWLRDSEQERTYDRPSRPIRDPHGDQKRERGPDGPSPSHSSRQGNQDRVRSAGRREATRTTRSIPADDVVVADPRDEECRPAKGPRFAGSLRQLRNAHERSAARPDGMKRGDYVI